jgi:hypothetical protein
MPNTPLGQIAASDAAFARARRSEERVHSMNTHPDAELPRPVDPDGPTLSVVVTAHNVGPWIGELLESLRNQTFTDVEYLLIDDHSSDETAPAVDAIAAEDPRFRVIRPAGRGGAHARNVGADHARGRLLAFCDGDDIVPKHAYESLVAAADGQDIVFGDFLKFFPERTWHPTKGVLRNPRVGIALADHVELIYYRAVWNKVFRTEFWREHDIVFPEVTRSNDIVPMVTAYLAADTMAIVPTVTYLYRDRPGATSMTSKVGSRDSLRSYLRQETACSELVANHAAADAWQRLFAGRDGWVQVSSYLLDLDGDPVDPETVGQVRHLWSLIDPDVRAKLAVERLVTFETLAGPTPDAATDVAYALSPKLSVDDPDRWLATGCRLLSEQRELLADVADLPDLVGQTFAAGLRRLLLSDIAGAAATDESGPALLAGIRALLDAIDRACGETPPSIANLNVRLHGALDALRAEDTVTFTDRLARAKSFSMELTSVTRTRGGLLLAGELTTGDGLTPKHLVKRLPTGHHEIARISIDPDLPNRWTAAVGSKRLPAGRKHRINVIGQIGSAEEMFHLTHADGLAGRVAHLPTATLELLAPRDRFAVHLRWTMRAPRARRLAGRLRQWLAGR